MKRLQTKLYAGTPNKSTRPLQGETDIAIYETSINWPKISILTPSYNQGKYIEQTIQSIIKQDYPNLEYIIIDGGSTDNTIEIIKKYEKYLTYWVSEPDRGQAHAINKGLEKATGDIFNWINSDDYLEQGSLFEIGKHFVENPHTNVLCGYTHCFYQETGQTSHTYRMGVKKTVADTILHVEMNQPGSFYRMDIVKNLGGVNESLRYVFDDELWFRYLCNNGKQKIVFIERLIAHFRLHGNSKSLGEGYDEFKKEINAIYYEMGRQLKFPAYILNELEKRLLSFNYKSEDWDFTELEKDAFLAYFCNMHQYTFYKDFKYKEAVLSYNHQKMYYKFDKKSLFLFIKLFVIPRVILKKLRKQ